MLRPLAQLIAGLLGKAQDLRRLLRCVSLGIVQLDPRPVPGGQAEDALGEAVLPLGWDGEAWQILQGDLLARAMSMALLSVTITTKALVFGLSTAKILEKFFAMARKASWTASSASCSLGKICRATWNMSRSYRAARARNLLCSSGPSTMARARASTAPPPFSHMVPLASTSLFFTKYSMPE